MISDVASVVGERRRVWLRYRSARREETEQHASETKRLAELREAPS